MEKHLDVPHLPQEGPCSCSKAVLDMLFLSFNGIPLDAESMTDDLDITDNFGSDNKTFARVLRRYFDCVVNDTGNATIEDIERSIDAGYPVVVNFLSPFSTNPRKRNPHADKFLEIDRFPLPDGFDPSKHDGHYALIIGYTDTDLIFNDPAFGENHKISKAEFETVWRAYYVKHIRWMVKIRALLAGSTEPWYKNAA